MEEALGVLPRPLDRSHREADLDSVHKKNLLIEPNMQ